jgi:tetratricopeptide (TPR) repeat protein
MSHQSLRHSVSNAFAGFGLRRLVAIPLLGLASTICIPLWGQTADAWQAEVQKDVEAHDWAAALRIIDAEIARYPQDMDIRARRARVLQWAGRTQEAEQEFNEVLKKAPDDPDNWLGLGTVYVREGRLDDALRAMNRAVELDPKRADLRAARARVLRAMGNADQARQDFQQALALDPTSSEARADLASMRGPTKNELRIGVDNDLFNFTSANHDQWTSLVTSWSPHWKTSAAGYFFQYNGIDAGKFVGSVTGTARHWGSLTVGGAIGHDNTVIPKSEAFFEGDRGWKRSENGVVRGVEVVYSQHWYWYSTARILTLTETSIVYLPRDWTWSLAVIEARSHFTDTPIGWKPSGVAKLGFPVAGWGQMRLTGNVFFAVGTEDFAQVNQIGSFSSQTYGGGFRLQLTDRQDITSFASYQIRTHDRTDTGFGLSYGIRF